MKKLLSIGLLVALIAVVLLPALPVSAAPDWLGTWAYRVELTIDNTDIDDVLAGFPILVYLSASSGRNSDDVSFVFDELVADANRKKIAVTASDGETECYVEIEKWDDANEKAWLWVKVPAVASGADTILYLYYDVDHADNDAYVGDTNDAVAENVWDANFIGVWHMRDGADTSHIYDSTFNDNDGTKRDAAEPAITTSGKISDAQDFDGANDYIGLAQNFMATPTDLTMEVWFKTAMAGAGVLVDVEGAYTMIVGWKTVGKIAAIADGSSANYVESGVVNDDGWHHAVLVNDGNLSTLYIDGGSVDTAAETLYDIDTLARVSEIGAIWGASSNWFNGLLDEVRISSTDRGAAWIKASYESERDDLLDFGAEEEPAFPTVVTYNADVDGTNVTANGEITATGNGDDDIRGFVWDTVTHDPPGNVAPAASGYANNWTETGAFGVGEFSYELTGLTEETLYYYRAVAHSVDGWGYGREAVFLVLVEGKVYLDLHPHIDETIVRANGKPTEVQIGIYSGYSLPVWNAGANVDEELYFEISIVERWDGESNIPLHIYTALANANESGHNFRLEVAWEIATPNEEVVPITSNPVFIDRTIYSDNQYEFYRDYVIVDIDIDPADIIMHDDLLAFRVRRVAVGGQDVELDGELILLHTGVLFARGDLLGDPDDILTEGGIGMVLLALILIPLGLTIAMFMSRNMMLGFPCAIFWAILGGYFYTLSEATWDIYYLLFFASAFGMTSFTILAAYALRTKKEEKVEEDEYIDEGKGDLRYIDEGKGGESSESEESQTSERTRKLRKRADNRRSGKSRRTRL